MNRNSGAIYRVWRDGRVEPHDSARVRHNKHNGLDGAGQFLTADTLRNEIYAYEYQFDVLRGKRLFAAGPERGYPDGSCMDAHGRLWNCRVAGGSCIACYSPAGTLDPLVELPCSWPTSCAFAGAHLDRLYVTSARFTMSEEYLRAHPDEGALFVVSGCGSGRAEYRFA